MILKEVDMVLRLHELYCEDFGAVRRRVVGVVLVLQTSRNMTKDPCEQVNISLNNIRTKTNRIVETYMLYKLLSPVIKYGQCCAGCHNWHRRHI